MMPSEPIQTNASASTSGPSGYLLTVHSRSEKKVAAALSAKGFEVLLPMQRVNRQYSDRVKIKDLPLFACCVFCRYDYAKDHMRVVSTPNVLVGVGSDPRPIMVPESEIETLRALSASGLPISAASCPARGKRVRIQMDSTSQVEGILAEAGGPCRVFVNLQTFGRAVAVEVSSDNALRTTEPHGPGRQDD